MNSSSAWDDLDDQLFGYEFAAGDAGAVQAVGLIEFQDDAAGLGCVRGLQCLQDTATYAFTKRKF